MWAEPAWKQQRITVLVDASLSVHFLFFVCTDFSTTHSPLNPRRTVSKKLYSKVNPAWVLCGIDARAGPD